jgi:hypothetical protein
VPEGDEQVGLAGAGVPDQAQGVAAADPVAGGELVDGGGVDGRVGGEVEVGRATSRGGTRRLDPAQGGAAVAVVDLGQQQLGEEALVGQLFLGRAGHGFVDDGADGGQPQPAAGLVDRGLRGFLGQAAPAAQRVRDRRGEVLLAGVIGCSPAPPGRWGRVRRRGRSSS